MHITRILEPYKVVNSYNFIQYAKSDLLLMCSFFFVVLKTTGPGDVILLILILILIFAYKL
jgi:hypothetical protein